MALLSVLKQHACIDPDASSSLQLVAGSWQLANVMYSALVCT
jgi:hypothetical protein